MSFADHKITEFTHRITDLPDQPTLSPRELKARFDSSPEELRQAHNAVCDEGERLSARVEGIVTDTFGDTIDREMLSHELAAEPDAKAEQITLDAETAAREALSGRVGALESAVPQKCQIYIGTYTGDGAASQKITLGFTPKAVFIAQNGLGFQNGNYYGAALAVTGQPARLANDTGLAVENGGFRTYQSETSYHVLLNSANTRYIYIAFA